VVSDDIVAQIGVELSWIEKHGTEALNNLDHAALLVALRDEIERLRAEVNLWMGAAERFAESHPHYEAFQYYFRARTR
jgi:hypothetical protein